MNEYDGLSHIPVLVDVICEYIDFEKPFVFFDGTIGGGGHSAYILEKAKEDTIIIGVDLDKKALKKAYERLLLLKKGSVYLFEESYTEILDVVKRTGVDGVDYMLIDAGMSSYQLDGKEGGFSISDDTLLDLRFNKEEGVPAIELVRTTPLTKLESILREYSDIRSYKKCARILKEAVVKRKLKKSRDIANFIDRFMPKSRGKVKESIRVFQALRILVNNEFENIRTFIQRIPHVLNPGGICFFISYHSGEDRICKTEFRKLPDDFQVLTRKPIVPTEEEIKKNPRARSAKLRMVKRIK